LTGSEKKKDEGRAKGQQEKRLKIACNLKYLGATSDVIAQTTELTMDEIQRIEEN